MPAEAGTREVQASAGAVSYQLSAISFRLHCRYRRDDGRRVYLSGLQRDDTD